MTLEVQEGVLICQYGIATLSENPDDLISWNISIRFFFFLKVSIFAESQNNIIGFNRFFFSKMMVEGGRSNNVKYIVCFWNTKRIIFILWIVKQM